MLQVGKLSAQFEKQMPLFYFRLMNLADELA